MTKTITPEVLIAYSQCLRKAFLLLCSNQKGTPHEYVNILNQRKRENQDQHIKSLWQKGIEIQPYTAEALKSRANFVSNAILQTAGLEAECGLLTKAQGHSSLGNYHYEPTIFVGTHKISTEQRLELAFVSFVLGRLQDKPPEAGKIIGADGNSHRVELENTDKLINPLLEALQDWAANSPLEPPTIVLNKHCPTCPFQSSCRVQAEQEDNLSLLNRMTKRAIQKYEKKGIFTVKQLSYLYKPRKRKKGAKKSPVTHNVELQALAIRTGKIYLQELPELARQPTELFLDMEGIPDQDMYYLIGLLVCEADSFTYHHFWANTPQEEAQIWWQFLEMTDRYPDIPIYHYGDFEPRAIVELSQRYAADPQSLKNRLINVNSHIYGKIYFPVWSNGLKDIGKAIGAFWTSSQASGLQSLVWRHYWDETQDVEYQNQLIKYNQEDCQALRLLTDKLSQIKGAADTLPEVDFANQPKQLASETGEQIHTQFKMVLNLAHFNYDKAKISFSKGDNQLQKRKTKTGSKKDYQGQRKIRPKAMKVIQVPHDKFCPKHELEPLCTTPFEARRLIIDLVLTKKGIKKTIIEYIGIKGYCPQCQKYYDPTEIKKYRMNQMYGHRFKAFLIYQRVALRMPYQSIGQVMEDQFGEKLSERNLGYYIKEFGNLYAETEQHIIRRLLESPFIHADETPISIRGVNQYVWVFTDGKYVVLKLTATREAAIVHEFLANYHGILISDFYPGYDSINCRQQKCWVHLIRDLNNDLWTAPFDFEFEQFILAVRNLFIPIMESVQSYGLKKRHLNRFKRDVEIFYSTIIAKSYKSELAQKYQKRFTRYRESLFTFLEDDGIPWHNNTAERGIRHLAKQRAISGAFFEAVTHHYLRLLGIMQTCRFQNKSFLRFLFSGEMDVDVYRNSKSRPVKTQDE